MVLIPSLLRPHTGGQRQVQVDGATVGEVLENLSAQYSGVRERLFQGERLQPGMSVAVNGLVGPLQLLERVEPDSEITIVPAISGGSTRPRPLLMDVGI